MATAPVPPSRMARRSPARKRRRHPARAARVLATGISVSAVFALTAAMGVSARTAPASPGPTVASVTQVVTAPSPRPRKVVVIRRTVVVPAPSGARAPQVVAPRRATAVVPPATAPRNVPKRAAPVAPAPAPAPRSNATTGGSR